MRPRTLDDDRLLASLRSGPAALASTDARTLAHNSLALTREEFSRAFSESPTERVLRRLTG